MEVKKKRDCILALVAIPRTGTNFLCSILNYHPLITSYYEIFNRKKFHAGYQNRPEAIIEYINLKYSVNFVNCDDVKLIEWIHNNPNKLIDTITKFNPEQYVSFKLFPEHLDHLTIKSVILENRNIKIILVKRNLLATFVSNEIALKINKWDNFDTSDIKVSLSVEKFANWVNWAKEWYCLFESNHYLKKEEAFVLNYEDIHAHKTNTDKLIYIDTFLKSIGLDLGTGYQIPDINHINTNQKQDTRKNLEEKIINYHDFTQKAKKSGLSKYF